MTLELAGCRDGGITWKAKAKNVEGFGSIMAIIIMIDCDISGLHRIHGNNVIRAARRLGPSEPVTRWMQILPRPASDPKQ